VTVHPGTILTRIKDGKTCSVQLVNIRVEGAMLDRRMALVFVPGEGMTAYVEDALDRYFRPHDESSNLNGRVFRYKHAVYGKVEKPTLRDDGVLYRVEWSCLPDLVDPDEMDFAVEATDIL
jgi:hypothetical protein